MDTIGTTFYPVIQHRLTFSKSLTNRTWTFPSESVRVQWITSISRPLHICTSGFPIEEKGIRLESGRQYWTTLQWAWILSQRTQRAKNIVNQRANIATGEKYCEWAATERIKISCLPREY